jgi:putative ABC transport system ATP-binding protein/macrolide transport system ATP-binding/permease protein/lipoprotein-releasing system ATP-binding protein
MLEARGLHKTYSTGQGTVPAVVDVSLRIELGEFVAVCGRSGSGKSTLLAMLGGLCRPSQGTVTLEGIEVWLLSADARAELRNRRIGFVFQFASLLPSLRAVDNVALPALLDGARDMRAAYGRAEELLASVGLHGRCSAYPAELSGGEQRRVALARALINAPPVILADEPTSDLDEEAEAEVFRLLLDLHHRHRTTLVVVTHSPEIARQADRVISLRGGRVIEATDRGPTGQQLDSSLKRKRREPEPSLALQASSDGARSAEEPEPSLALQAPANGAATVPLGAGLGRFVAGFAAWTVLVVLGILALNYGVALFQQRSFDARQAARKKLEMAAMQQLRADVEDMAYNPDGTCRLTVYLQNLEPERPLLVLMPSVRVHVQVERGWEEVPCRSTSEQEGQVIRLTGRQRFEFVFKPEVKKFEEQLAGYLHVRISNALLVSTSSEPRDDLFERADAYYVYLKPHNADDALILKRNGWSGKPPLWIPMPPH